MHEPHWRGKHPFLFLLYFLQICLMERLWEESGPAPRDAQRPHLQMRLSRGSFTFGSTHTRNGIPFGEICASERQMFYEEVAPVFFLGSPSPSALASKPAPCHLTVSSPSLPVLEFLSRRSCFLPYSLSNSLCALPASLM